MTANDIPATCPLCDRPLGEMGNVSKHHLVPKSEGGRHGETVILHHICHQKIHSLFTERELATIYNTIDDLKSHPEMWKFIKWVRKQDPDFYQRNRRSKKKGSR